ncbi:methyltransferase domain-containing protein [Streptomyces sp. NPDC005805]|uniref:class I SAM-dependent methyltransferase n=1 Tax=Streptomyces sp. NPDC005805 TaxID=3157068 RepID=UPI003401BBCA
MAEQYDSINARRYDYQRRLEIFSPEKNQVAALSGDLHGLKVMDLACGTGLYSRYAKRAGADKVVGVDISANMLKVAQKIEESAPLGITYRLGDASRMEKIDNFDLVLAIYLFNYARTLSELQEMCTSAFANLRPGGRLVALTINPLYDMRKPVWKGWYSPFTAEYAEDDCTRYATRVESSCITYYRRGFSAYEESLSSAGFEQQEWHPISVPPSLLAGPDASEWIVLEKNPPMIALSAQRLRS